MQTVIKNPNWWRRRTTLERCLTLVSVFAIIAVIGLVVGLVTVIVNNKAEELKPPESLQGSTLRPSTNEVPETSTKPADKERRDVCLTAECIHTASSVLSKMKPEIEPCDDFYRFACGTYLDEETIPDDHTSISTFTVITDKLQEYLKEIIEEDRSSSPYEHLKLPNKLYRACMNKTLIEQLGVSPIQNIAESFGGWPLLKGDAWNADNSWSWTDTIRKFRRNGFSTSYILEFSISVDLKNSTNRLIDLDQSVLSLSREYLVKGFNETLVTAHYNYMVDMAVLFGANKEQAKKELLEALEFEMQLAAISLPSEKRRNSSDLYNIRSIKQMQQAYPYMNWLEYINNLLPEGLNVDETELVNACVLSFFEQLGPLLERTPKRTIANYMMWRIHSFSVTFLTEEFRKRQLEYSTALTGRQEKEARWKECVDITTGRLSISVGSLYVRKHFKQDSKAIAMAMVENIREVFDGILRTVDWMDEKTRASAITKLHAMSTHIGYPDEMLDDNILAEYYKGLTVDPDRYFDSYREMTVFGTDYAYNKLRLPFNKTEWVRHASPAVVNAYYSSIENSIQFPAGILQGHFFHAQRPKYMNYGAIGYVIGHEITHGFDDQGCQFDLDGNLVDWWAQETKEAYLAKAQCIIQQYGNYTELTTGLKLNGINTQGENIADNGGLKESYIAYRKWAEQNGGELKLPGLDYTPEQMFWISAGQTWCSKSRKESLKNRITTGVHSPSEFRVLGPMSNMVQFANDFNCPEGSVMHPVDKCEVW